MADPAETLRWYYTHPLAAARLAADAGHPVIGITATTVPSEIIAAAGAFPVVLRRPPGPTPLAGEYLEPDVFAPRIRGIFEGLASGEWPFLRAVVIPRTSEQEYKLFLYLRELTRDGALPHLPPVFLYDLLHTQSQAAFEHGLARTVDLKARVEQLTGRCIDLAAMNAAIGLANAARRATARLLRLRSGRPRVRGADALPLLGACQFMDPAEYAPLAEAAAGTLEDGPEQRGPRVVVSGAPVDDDVLHATIESLGAVVTWEEDYGGGRIEGPDIVEGSDPLAAIFDHYYHHVPSPRVFPCEASDAPFEAAVRGGADGVVFYLPPDDSVAGWDYPRRKRFAERLGIPTIMVRETPEALTDDGRECLARFVAGLRART